VRSAGDQRVNWGIGSLRYLFEDYVFDTDRRELRCGAEAISVAPQVFDLIEHLVRNRERVVSKDDLISAVWNGRIVSDAALTTRLNAARSAVGDSGEKQHLIKTLPRKGFRFIAAVQEVQRPADAAPAIYSAGDGTCTETGTWIERMRERPATPLLPEARRLSPIEDRPSIAVLPFVDLSLGGEDNGPLADGLTEETTSAMARLPGFFVTSRHSAMAYKGAGIDVRRIAADLGVRYLLEASVERSNRRLRANVRLIDGRTGLHIWAQTHDSRLSDLMEVRDDIVRDSARQLYPKLMMVEMRRALARPPRDLDAWAWLQRANGTMWLDRCAGQSRQAISALEQALSIDPDYAMAHALLSAIYTWRVVSWASPAPPAERQRASEHAEAAMRAEPENPFVLVHSAIATIYFANDFDRALAMLERAVELGPNEADGLALLAHARNFAGKNCDASLLLTDQAMRVSPRDPRTHAWHHFAGCCHWRLGDLEAMEAACRRSIELYSRNPWGWVFLACSLGLQRRSAEATEAVTEVKRLVPGFSAQMFFETVSRFHGPRFRGEAEAGFSKLRSVLEQASVAG
jgi:TolB-like protein/DNA-binding winged helix-turn-helix (wHTH) protein/Tfp pilus assembly protein PilF